jgi:hypothetical protein
MALEAIGVVLVGAAGAALTYLRGSRNIVRDETQQLLSTLIDDRESERAENNRLRKLLNECEEREDRRRTR